MAKLPIEDRWILSRLATTAAAVTEQLEGYHFSDVARTLYEFTWSEFCDWYVEMSKGRLKDPPSRPIAQRVLVGVLDAHPAAGAADHAVRGRVDLAGAERGGPGARPADAGEGGGERLHRPVAERYPDEWRDAGDRDQHRPDAGTGRRRPRSPQPLHGRSEDGGDGQRALCGGESRPDFEALEPFIRAAGRRRLVRLAGRIAAKPPQAASIVQPEFEAYVSLAGLIDVAEEVQRLEKQLAEKRKHLAGDAGEAGQRELRRTGAGRGGAAAARPGRRVGAADSGDRGEFAGATRTSNRGGSRERGWGRENSS